MDKRMQFSVEAPSHRAFAPQGNILPSSMHSQDRVVGIRNPSNEKYKRRLNIINGNYKTFAALVVAVLVFYITPFDMHLTTPSLALLALAAGGASRPLDDTTTSGIPEPPSPEPIDLAELPLPPVAPTNDVGACTAELNPRGTGCIERLLGKYLFQAGDFTPDGNHIIATVNFVGAPASPDPASIYSGAQLILLKTDGTTFSNGDYWKCLTCAVPASQKQSIHSELDYPHVFRSGTKALFGRK